MEFLFLLAVRDIWVERKWSLFQVLIFIALLGIAFALFLYYGYGYNHFKSLQTAMTIENPDGFRLLAHPIEFIMTRIEDCFEIMLFISIGVLAYMCKGFREKHISWKWQDWRGGIFILPIIALGILFLTGAYRTGETARSALYLLPFVFFALAGMPKRYIKDMTILAGMQTLVMQLCGTYFW